MRLMPLLFPLILMLITKISADQHYKRSTINKISLARGGEMTSIGGGAINEKNRTRVKGKRCSGEDKVENSNGNGSDSGDGFDPSNKLSHLLHSAVGIDRYPRYLHRWNGPDLDRLESALEGTLQLVRTQRKEMKKRNRDIEILLESSRQSVSPDLEIDWSILDPPDSWADIRKILDPRAADAIFLSSSFRCKESSPSLDEILSGNIAVQLDFSQLDGWLEEEAEGVYSFPLLSESVSLFWMASSSFSLFCTVIPSQFISIFIDFKAFFEVLAHIYSNCPHFCLFFSFLPFLLIFPFSQTSTVLYETQNAPKTYHDYIRNA